MAGPKTLNIVFAADPSDVVKAFGKMDKDAGDFGSKLDQHGKDWGDKFKAFGKVAGAALLGVGVAAGKFALDAFKDVDAGMDAVRIGTGKVGKELEGLQKNFRMVAQTVPNSQEEVGTALAGLSQRLNLTGKELEKLTKQELNLARLTKTDINEVVDASTRLFGDWSIATGKQSQSLDALYRLSTQTKVPIGELMRMLVQFGAPLRGLGFDFQTAAALFGKFQAEGVNTEAVMAGLKVGLANIASAGKPVNETFLQAIQNIKDAKTPTEALTQGIEIFGKRAGPDLVEAIQQGRFDGLEPLITDMGRVEESINRAAEDTDDFDVKWQTTMNNAKLFAAGFITPTLDALNEALGNMNTKVGEGQDLFAKGEEVGQGFLRFLRAVEEEVTAIQEDWTEIVESVGVFLELWQKGPKKFGQDIKKDLIKEGVASRGGKLVYERELPNSGALASLQHGGVVAAGAVVPALLHGPEAVIPLSSTSSIASPINVTVNVQGSYYGPGGEQELARTIFGELLKMKRAGHSGMW